MTGYTRYTQCPSCRILFHPSWNSAKCPHRFKTLEQVPITNPPKNYRRLLEFSKKLVEERNVLRNENRKIMKDKVKLVAQLLQQGGYIEHDGEVVDVFCPSGEPSGIQLTWSEVVDLLDVDYPLRHCYVHDFHGTQKAWTLSDLPIRWVNSLGDVVRILCEGHDCEYQISVPSDDNDISRED